MRQKSIVNASFLLTSLLMFGSISGKATNAAQAAIPRQEITIQSAPLQVVNQEIDRKISAPAAFQQNDSVDAAVPEDFVITYTGDWSEEAKTAFNYAASIWSFLIDPSVKIAINARSDYACFFCGARSFIELDYFPNMPRENIVYPRTLVNHFSGYDVLPDDYDFEIVYDSVNIDWYYGTDGNTPGGQYDFVTAILHEICHGLGFVDSFNVDASMGSWGVIYGYPTIYDTFIVNGDGQSLIDTSLFPNRSPELRAQLKSDTIFFDGPMTRSANQNLRAKVHAYTDPHGDSPETISHLNDLYYGTPDGLMTSTIYPGESIHDPGPMVLGMLADLGWTLSPNLPVLTPLPSQMMLINTQRTNAIDLWEFIPSELSPGTNFTYTITNSPAPGAGVSLHDNRYIDLIPALNWLGKTRVMI